MKTETRIIGLKKAIHDMMTISRGWYCGMWAKRIDKDTMKVWSCKYLTWNPLIAGYEKEGKRIYPDVIGLHDRYGYSWTRAIRAAAEEEIDHSDFRLGNRGICIEFHWFPPARNYVVSVPRAHIEIRGVEVKLFGDEMLALNGGETVGYIELNNFDKLTRLPRPYCGQVLPDANE